MFQFVYLRSAFDSSDNVLIKTQVRTLVLAFYLAKSEDRFILFEQIEQAPILLTTSFSVLVSISIKHSGNPSWAVSLWWLTSFEFDGVITLTLTQFISDNNNRITQMWLKYNYTFTTTNEIKITHFTIQVIDKAFCS